MNKVIIYLFSHIAFSIEKPQPQPIQIRIAAARKKLVRPIFTGNCPFMMSVGERGAAKSFSIRLASVVL